jgi:hypothetical protein
MRSKRLPSAPRAANGIFCIFSGFEVWKRDGRAPFDPPQKRED